jgi:hypothetical protein
VAFSLKSITAKLLGPHAILTDTFKGLDGRGLNQRYCEMLSAEFDEELLPLIENLYDNVSQPQLAYVRYLPFISKDKGLEALLGAGITGDRGLINFAIRLHQVRGTIKFYRAVYGILSPTVFLIEVGITNYTFDSPTTFDSGIRPTFDSGGCNACFFVNITLESAIPLTTKLAKGILAIARYGLPINGILGYISYNGAAVYGTLPPVVEPGFLSIHMTGGGYTTHGDVGGLSDGTADFAEWTISVRIKIITLTSFTVIASKETEWTLSINSLGQPLFEQYDFSSGYGVRKLVCLCPPFSVVAGGWFTITVFRSAAFTGFVINNELYGASVLTAGAYTKMANSTSNLCLGRFLSAGVPVASTDMLMCDFCMWDVAVPLGSLFDITGGIGALERVDVGDYPNAGDLTIFIDFKGDADDSVGSADGTAVGSVVYTEDTP